MASLHAFCTLNMSLPKRLFTSFSSSAHLLGAAVCVSKAADVSRPGARRSWNLWPQPAHHSHPVHRAVLAGYHLQAAAAQTHHHGYVEEWPRCMKLRLHSGQGFFLWGGGPGGNGFIRKLTKTINIYFWSFEKEKTVFSSPK